jgi:hypothetical protein
VLPLASVVGTLATYPDPARVQSRELRSQHVFGECRNVDPATMLAGLEITVDLAGLGFVPPFSVVK